MKLGRVKLEIKARYGKQEWQTTYANGNFWIEHPPAVDSSSFTDTGTLDISALCSFRFQESKLFGEISKFLSCKNAGASLPRAVLTNKTVNLNIEVNPEEEPTHDDMWIRFPNGWKPCAVKDGWRWCRTPIEFKNFKMNGETCTVYPNCKENKNANDRS